MEATIRLPAAFSVRDEHEFLPFQHLLARLNAKLVARRVATGKHVDGGGTVFWGLVFLEDEPPSKKAVEAALREAGIRLRPQRADPALGSRDGTVGPRAEQDVAGDLRDTPFELTCVPGGYHCSPLKPTSTPTEQRRRQAV